MKYGRRTHSLTLRLFSTIILGMLALNLLTLYSTHRLAETARENTWREYQQVQTMYADELGRQLRQAQERMDTLISSYQADMGTSPEALGDERAYEAVRCQTEIASTLRDWGKQFPLITGYYLYGEKADVLIFEGTGYQSSAWFSEEIRGAGKREDSPFRQMAGWQMLETGLGKLLLFNTLRRDLRAGVWVETGRLLSALLPDQETAGRFSILAAEGEAEDGRTIDVPLAGLGCMLRQRLPETAMELPASVRILTALSYAMLLILPISWLVLRILVIRPLQEMMKAIREIEQGNISYRIPEKASSFEFDQLNRQFNRSLEAMARARSQIYETRLDNERTRIQYLTQQMQPHFVLNTLNLIYSMEPSQFPLIQRTVQCLSRYYRYIAHISEPFVPMEAELEHVRNYFELQTIRYPGSFSYSITCPEELKSVMIPPIVIQTFAENAIKHSLTVGEQNRVDVDIREEQARIHISLHDSGKGYPPEVLEKIRTFQEQRIPQEGLGLGIQNTIERISLLYEHSAEILFSNPEGGGARVDIILPKANQTRHGRNSRAAEGREKDADREGEKDGKTLL